MTTHDLKCWTEPFNAVRSGKKKFEFRLNDRDYKVGDELILREWDPVKKFYTGQVITRKYITYLLTEGFGLPKGYCIMSWHHKFQYNLFQHREFQ